MKELDPETATSLQRGAWNSLTHYQAQQLRNLRWFVGLTLASFVVQLVLLHWDASGWLALPLGLTWAVLSLCLWSIDSQLEGPIASSKAALQLLEEQRFPTQGKDAAPDALRLFARGHAGSQGLRHLSGAVLYVLIASASLYFGVLPLLRGKLPGWEVPKPVAATPAPAASGNIEPFDARRPGMQSLGGTPRPGVFPHSFGAPPGGTPFRVPGFTPPPRPFATPATMRPMPTGPNGPNANAPGFPGNPAGAFRPGVPPNAAPSRPLSTPPPAATPGSTPGTTSVPGAATPSGSNSANSAASSGTGAK